MIHKITDDPALMWTIYETGLSDLFLTTANATVRDGELIMGKGHALQMKQRIGGSLPKVLARAIDAHVTVRVMEGEWREIYREVGNERIYGDYYLLVSDNWPKVRVGLFQTKRHYSDTCEKISVPGISGYDYSVKNMIYWSTQALVKWCQAHPDKRVDMPFPGIGAGKCEREPMLEMLDRYLPDNVYVWELAQ